LKNIADNVKQKLIGFL